MEKQFISIKQACNDFNKSLSTIRRLIKEAPKNQLKKEKLKTGHEKIFISTDYLNKYFNTSNESSKNNSSINNSSNNSDITIEILRKELEEKNKQIESLLSTVKDAQQRQYESNVIIERLQQKEQTLLESLENKKKRRWWQRKK